MVTDTVNNKAAEATGSAASTPHGSHNENTERLLGNLQYVDISCRTYCRWKRIADILLSAAGLLVLFLPLCLIALLVYLDDPGTVVFRQYRVGQNGKLFQLYKFRTMRADAPHYVSTRQMVHSDQYITRVGSFLRKTSLDEIPQLLNVLRGEMSLVGPRPLIPEETDIHTLRSRFGVYNLRPGVTGLAQINGRDLVEAIQKVYYDVKYLEKLSPLLDLKILLATVPKVLGKDGIVEGFQQDS